jgi:hypothetical protein
MSNPRGPTRNLQAMVSGGGRGGCGLREGGRRWICPACKLTAEELEHQRCASDATRIRGSYRWLQQGAQAAARVRTARVTVLQRARGVEVARSAAQAPAICWHRAPRRRVASPSPNRVQAPRPRHGGSTPANARRTTPRRRRSGSANIELDINKAADSTAEAR